jgi:hypothetical protein
MYARRASASMARRPRASPCTYVSRFGHLQCSIHGSIPVRRHAESANLRRASSSRHRKRRHKEKDSEDTRADRTHNSQARVHEPRAHAPRPDTYPCDTRRVYLLRYPTTYIQSYTEHSRLDSTLLDCHSSRSSTGHSRSPRRADIELRTACVGLSRTHIRAHGERSLLLSPPDFHRHVTHRAARPTVSIWVSQVTRTHKP